MFHNSMAPHGLLPSSHCLIMADRSNAAPIAGQAPFGACPAGSGCAYGVLVGAGVSVTAGVSVAEGAGVSVDVGPGVAVSGTVTDEPPIEDGLKIRGATQSALSPVA